MYDKSTFATRLKSICGERGLSQRDLAERLNTTEATISRYVSGFRTPNVETAIEIARILNVSLDSLMGVSTPDSIPQPPDISILISCYKKASFEQQEYIWSSLDMLGIITPDQKAVIAASRYDKKAEAM